MVPLAITEKAKEPFLFDMWKKSP